MGTPAAKPAKTHWGQDIRKKSVRLHTRGIPAAAAEGVKQEIYLNFFV